ncbi:MAG: outer membrane protein transport protein [Balneolaceae bacterium]|nr:outer membrane protein transport protein [Balneolaceae bacterium]
MRRIIATVCLIFLGSSSAFASGFSIYEASVRANGMLGAFSAYADHASTIFYNPAGLGGMEGLNISAGASIIAPRSSFRNMTPLAPHGAKYEMKEQEFFVPNFYATYEITDGLTAGLGVYAEFGLGTEWDQDWAGRASSTKASIETITVNPAVGYEIANTGIGTIRLGAGLRAIAHGTVELARAVTDFTPEGSFSLEGDLKEPAFGYNLGIMYSPLQEVTLGFTYRSSIEAEFEGEAEFNNLAVGFPETARGGTKIEFPASYVVALNVKPIPNLTLEADYLWWGWSSYDELVINFDQPIPALASPESPDGSRINNPRNFEDSYQIRFGAEYSQFGVEGLTLRGGIAYDENPIPERDVDPTLPDSDRIEFSGGLTYAVSDHIEIDAAYIFIRANQRKVEDTRSGIDGVYNTYANIPSLGITLNY